MVPCISFLCTSHSPNHAYTHEIIHLEHPPTWKKQARKKSLPKATKRLEINTPSEGICKGKNHQLKQKFTKATKTLQINSFLKGIWKGKSTYSIIFNHRCINSMMVRRHQFPVYLTLTKSCIYGRNHTLRTPPILGKSNQEEYDRRAVGKFGHFSPNVGKSIHGVSGIYFNNMLNQNMQVFCFLFRRPDGTWTAPTRTWRFINQDDRQF